jgi:RNA-directed DNA polymerase
LRERGLALSEEKTRIVHLTEGFNFLGFTIRHYAAPASKHGYKLLITPSKESASKKRKELRDLWRHMRHWDVVRLCQRLNPVIRGWANYFRTVVASRTFAKMEKWMLHRQVRYVNRLHPRKTCAWRRRRYWGRLNKDHKDHWVFGDKKTGQHLVKFSWFRIRRHVLVRGRSSPDDPSLREYWWSRQKVNARYLSADDLELAIAQDWVCRLCGMDLINGEELHRHHRTPKGRGGTEAKENRELVHLFCHQQIHSRLRREQAAERKP